MYHTIGYRSVESPNYRTKNSYIMTREISDYIPGGQFQTAVLSAETNYASHLFACYLHEFLGSLLHDSVDYHAVYAIAVVIFVDIFIVIKFNELTELRTITRVQLS